MTYYVSEFNDSVKMLDRINQLAKEYKSFRVVTIYQRLDSCDTTTNCVLMWFDQKDYEAFTLAKT